MSRVSEAVVDRDAIERELGEGGMANGQREQQDIHGSSGGFRAGDHWQRKDEA